LINYNLLSWQSLIRPPLADEVAPPLPDVPLKALSCRNAVVNFSALVTSSEPVTGIRVELTDMVAGDSVIPAASARTRIVRATPTPEAGSVSDILEDVEEFAIDRTAALYVTLRVPRGVAAGVYEGELRVLAGGSVVARSSVELEVASVDLPDPRDWSFFLNVWMNPGAIAGRYGVEAWSEAHFELLDQYVADLAEHGQKTVVTPICDDPWGGQTRYSYPSLVEWQKTPGGWDFGFARFDRYVELHAARGIDSSIHCHSMVRSPGDSAESVLTYTDTASGRIEMLRTEVGQPEFDEVWAAFLRAFSEHLAARGWLGKTYLAFDEKPGAIIADLVAFARTHAPDLRIALAANTRSEAFEQLDDLSLHAEFDEKGIAEMAPSERSAMGVMELLLPGSSPSASRLCREKSITTFYICCSPDRPNTFIHSPLVESRMLPFLALQGGYDGLLRWSYNDWPDDPFGAPQWGSWPTGDTFLVYPGADGPVSSLRWEQLREGIQDYELATIASARLRDPEDVVDYEQAIALACRTPDGRLKATGDIEIARRLLIPIAAGE